LEGVLDVLAAAQQPPARPQDERPVPLDQYGEGALVAQVGEAAQQRLVRLGQRRRGRRQPAQETEHLRERAAGHVLHPTVGACPPCYCRDPSARHDESSSSASSQATNTGYPSSSPLSLEAPASSYPTPAAWPDYEP